MDPTELLVDETYQRAISEKSLRLIRRIVETFDWRKFKPPTVVWTDHGLEVIDGQHSAIAAATHPEITSIPVVVVDAAEIKDRAAAFVGINHDRLGVTPMQLHAAAVVAGDVDALALEDVCATAGVRILRAPPSNGAYRSRDTVAIQGIHALVRAHGNEGAVKVLKVLAEAELAPVAAAAIRAADYLLNSPEHADDFDPVDLTKAIVALGSQADRDAAVFAAERCVPRWRGLAAVWFKKTKKRKGDSESHAPKAASEPAQPVVPEGQTSRDSLSSQPPRSRAAEAAGALAKLAAPLTKRDRFYKPFKDGTYS